MRYAVVRENNVENVLECGNAPGAMRLELELHCTLVPCEQYPVQTGDTYENGVFYREGETIERIPTTDEKVAALENENQMLKSTVSASFQSQIIADRMAKANYITDNMILQSAYVVDYPEYEDNHQYDFVGEILQYNGRYYEVVAKHLSNATAYPVETTFAYYRLVELTHAGTLDDPIPYPEQEGILVNVESGKYYAYKGKVYLAKADMPGCVYPPDTPGMWQWEEAEV
jgi:hypothetical protein